MNKQQENDKSMKNDYNKIHNDLVDNKNSVLLISNKIERMNKDEGYKCLHPIIQDVEYLIQSLDYIYTSCMSQNGVSNSFFPYTRFYREIISTIKVIDEKVKDTFKQNNLFVNDINDDYKNIQLFMKNEFKWRKDLEHNIDPFYDGKLFDILNELDVDKIVKFANLICDLIDKIKLIGIKVVNFRSEIVTYKISPLEDRKELINESGDTFRKILEMVTQLSHIISKNKKKNETCINIVDLTFKYMELNKAVYFTYNILHTIDKRYAVAKHDDYSYFIRMSITTYYQFFDKLGFYLNNKLELNFEYPYYKAVVDEIRNRNLDGDKIVKSLCEPRDNDEYKELSRIRQRIIHNKKVFVDYRANSEAFSSLMASSLVVINNISYIILEDYFKVNSIKLSTDALNEASSKILSIKL